MTEPTKEQATADAKASKAAKAAEAKAAKEQAAADALEAKAIALSGLSAEAFAVLSGDERAAFLAQADQETGKVERDKKDSDAHLIAMQKDGETIRVHPSCVLDHTRLGWVEK